MTAPSSSTDRFSLSNRSTSGFRFFFVPSPPSSSFPSAVEVVAVESRGEGERRLGKELGGGLEEVVEEGSGEEDGGRGSWEVCIVGA
jgi:hypothetical protein